MKKVLICTFILAILLSGCGGSVAKEKCEPIEVSQAETTENINSEQVKDDTLGAVLDEQEPALIPENLPPEPDHVTLKLGVLNSSMNDISETVKRFNALQKHVTVEIVNYAENAGSEMEGAIKLKTELLAGDGPDLICFEQWMQNVNSPIPYIGKDMLIDLDPFVEADPSLSKEDFLVWNALHEYGGMYLLSSTCCVETLYCTQEVYAEHPNWTIDEYLKVEKSLSPRQDMIYSMDAKTLLTAFSSRYMQQALNLDQAVCDFNNAEFISIIDGARDAREYDGAAPEGKSVPERMVEGQLITCYLEIRNPSDIAFDRYRSGQTMAYIGWPTYDGSNGSNVLLNSAVGVNAQTKYPNACWKFVRYLLTEPILEEGSLTPMYVPKMNELVEKINASDIRYKITQEDINCMMEICAQCTHLGYYDATVMQIILEEANSVLKGDVTAEHAAATIQERASLYMLEQYS